MSYMRSTDSAVLQEFGRIIQEKDELKKVAQVTPPNPNAGAASAPLLVGKDRFPTALRNLMNANKANYKHLLETAIALAGAEAMPNGTKYRDALRQLRHHGLNELKSSVSGILASVSPVTPAPTRASLSTHEKTAEQKSYDVTGKEDMVHEAHPQTARVENEVVENLNEQQDADIAVAEKSAKNVLIALYKLAKRLKAEKNMKAYSLVKETFLDLSKSLKK